MNALERHGIQHLSPSSLNLWRASPGLWAARYLAGIKDETNAAMWRGDAIETGLRHILSGANLEQARSIALYTFESQALGEVSDNIAAERALVVPMLDRAAKWAAPGELAATQVRVEHWFRDLPVPIIGFLDFAFLNGPDVDLKTTKACPGTPRADHVRQVAFYRAAREKRGGLLYVTDRRWAYYNIDDKDTAAALADLEATARSLLRFLEHVENARDALSMLPIDGDHFRCSPEIRAGVEALLAS
jgi:hypothetical protein